MVVVLVLVLLSCRRDPSPFEINNLNNNTIGVFGHGGMGQAYKYPPNSFESLEACLRIGADGTEIDVQLTADSVLVLFHGDDLNTATAGNGAVNENAWTDIAQLQYANILSGNQRVLRLDDFLLAFANEERIFTFDCKLYRDPGVEYSAFIRTYANAINALITKHNLQEMVFIESSDELLLQLLHQINPELKLFIYPDDFNSGLEVAKRLDLFGITINHKKVSAGDIAAAHAQQIRVALWGMNTQSDNIEAVDKSPDYVQTDKLIHLLKMFGKYRK